ncbi:MAG: FprA family A-type flavoprotein [Nitrososphaerales archaeon]|nr:FprA family A-type flavoprotein [Nitrososphaerales archaeon]
MAKPLKITESVYWVGVNDPDARLFEGLWDIDEGVSYNSYLVLGSEKVVLIDSVGEKFVDEHLSKIGQIVDPSKIDYIVINHMEPDHTGAVPKILDVMREAKVIFTPGALAMIKALYHIEPKSMIVRGDDTTIDLGGKTLRFIQTPFLHWPETMSSYLVEEGVLFSCDLCGSFKQLPEGAILDTDIKDIKQYIYGSALKGYFAGVFSKYRDYVVKAVEKFDSLGLRIRVLAPSHGPVYTTYVKEVMNLWLSWSKPNYTKRVVIAFGSMYGSTSKFVDALADGVREAGGEATILNLVEATPIKMLEEVIDAPALIIGTPTYEYDIFPPVKYFINLLELKKLTDRFVGVFGTFAWAGGGVKNLVERLDTLGFKRVGNPVEVKGSPYPEDLERAKALARSVAEAAFKEHRL